MLTLEQVERVCGAPVWVWRETESGGLVVVLKTGQKYQFSPEEVKAKVVTPAAELPADLVTKPTPPTPQTKKSRGSRT
jgi:hypothetical protein